MNRLLVAHLPEFLLTCAGLEDHVVAAVAGDDVIKACTSAAKRRGVRVGQAVGLALAACPSLDIVDANDAHVFDELRRVCAQVLVPLPACTVAPPTALVAKLSPTVDEPWLISQVEGRLRHLGHKARLVIADDIDTALVCAEHLTHTTSQLVPMGGRPQALAPLPLDCLGLPKAHVQTLAGLGVRTVGAFQALPEEAIASRFGPRAALLHRCARGLAAATAAPMDATCMAWGEVEALLVDRQRHDQPDQRASRARPETVPNNVISFELARARRRAGGPHAG